MVTLTARQSVILKCRMQASVMLGNYEFYYGAGLFCRIKGIEVDNTIRPQALKETILPELEAFSGEDERERYLVKLLLNYAVSDKYDEQMKELLQWGRTEEKIWEVAV